MLYLKKKKQKEIISQNIVITFDIKRKEINRKIIEITFDIKQKEIIRQNIAITFDIRLLYRTRTESDIAAIIRRQFAIFGAIQQLIGMPIHLAIEKYCALSRSIRRLHKRDCS